MIGKALSGFAAALTFAFAATAVSALGPGGPRGVAGGGMRGMGAMNGGGRSSFRRVSPGSRRSIGDTAPGTNGLQNLTFPTNDPDHYHEIKLIGRLAKDDSGLTIDQQIVRMRVDGRTIPMSINGDAMSNSLQLDQGDELGQTLYRLILSRQLQVVGDQRLRSQIADAAAADSSKPVQVDGFVYDRMTPYLVLISVSAAP